MGTIRKKLHSRSGASISYALLLFLVCAVIGSVVLAAGMAAAGRVSALPEADQRYYSVTSAVELFRESFDGNQYEVKRVYNYTERVVTNYTTVDRDGVITVTTDNVTRTISNRSYSEVAGSPTDPFQRFAQWLVFGDVIDHQSNSAWSQSSPALSTDKTGTLELSVSGKDGLKVNVDYRLKPDGTVELSFYNADGSTTGNTFKIKMTLMLQEPIRDTHSGPTRTGVPSDSTVSGEAVTTTEEPVGDETVGHTIVTTPHVRTVVTSYQEEKTTKMIWTVTEVKVEGGGIT